MPENLSDSTDSLLRSVEAVAQQSAEAIASLSGLSDADLFAALAQRMGQVVEGSSTIADISAPVDVDDLIRGTASLALGQRVFRRWSAALYNFLCGTAREEEALRSRLMSALIAKEGGAVALIAGTLVAAFGASPAIAALVATLIMHLVITPAAQEICESWAKSLDIPRRRGRKTRPS
jgi:hypothetical protein